MATQTATRHGAVARDLALVVVTAEGDGLGFRLAGVPVEEVPPGQEEAALRALRHRRGVGVLAVEETVLRAAEPRGARRRRDAALPIVLAFSLPRRWAEPGRGRDLVAALVRRAVGYHVKLGGVRT